MLKMWFACPYSLKTSGHSVFCARCSSSGGPATADGIGFGARSGPCTGLQGFRPERSITIAERWCRSARRARISAESLFKGLCTMPAKAKPPLCTWPRCLPALLTDHCSHHPRRRPCWTAPALPQMLPAPGAACYIQVSQSSRPTLHSRLCTDEPESSCFMCPVTVRKAQGFLTQAWRAETLKAAERYT